MSEEFMALLIPQLFRKCREEEKLIQKQIDIAKEKVIFSWDKGYDEREFINKEISIERGYGIKISVLANNRGLVLSWKGVVLAIDNWGHLIHKFGLNGLEEGVKNE